jgi:hypothetical protein
VRQRGTIELQLVPEHLLVTEVLEIRVFQPAGAAKGTLSYDLTASRADNKSHTSHS